ncbi:MAG: hypothetical protein JST89_08405 [Cyanobacteria bacterium SZAS-4]|nr:hypothetical protein [Cyanobacteria bacterium SZAS-4]
MGPKLDKTTITVLCVLAFTAILLVIFMVYIVDRSSEHVAEIKKTKVMGPGENLASPLGSEDDLVSMNVKEPHPSYFTCTVADGTIKEAMFHKIADVKNLREVSFKRCEFSGADFKFLDNAHIDVVRFDNDKIDEECMQSIGRWPYVKSIEMSSCDVSPHALAHLSESNVRWLQLRYSQSTAAVPDFTADDLRALSELKKIMFLEVEKSKFAPGAFQAITSCPAMALNVERCDITDDDLVEIAKMPKLVCLNLVNNPKITCKGLKVLLNSKSIQQINFGDDIPKCEFTAAEKKKLSVGHFSIPMPMWQQYNRE